MTTIGKLVNTIIVTVAFGIPFLFGGVHHLKDECYDKRIAILEIILGAMYFSWDIIVWTIM